MRPRDRVLAALAHTTADRLPIKHLAVAEVDRRLADHLGATSPEDLLDRLGHDFREVRPAYRGPEFGAMDSEHGVISGTVMGHAIRAQRPHGLTEATAVGDLVGVSFEFADWYDYDSLPAQCAAAADYATILGYCEGDFINGLSGLRGYEQVLMDIGLAEPVYVELVERRFRAVFDHLERGLAAGGGRVDFVHFGEDLGCQNGPLFGARTYRQLFSPKYRALFELAHRHGARTMLHVCGSCLEFIPALIADGLDVLDVVQTSAAGMDLADLKRRFGRDLTFAGTMCVQQVLPFGTPDQVREEVRHRLDLFVDGGLILGPSHQIQPDTPTANILAMYEAAGRVQRQGGQAT